MLNGQMTLDEFFLLNKNTSKINDSQFNTEVQQTSILSMSISKEETTESLEILDQESYNRKKKKHKLSEEKRIPHVGQILPYPPIIFETNICREKNKAQDLEPDNEKSTLFTSTNSSDEENYPERVFESNTSEENKQFLKYDVLNIDKIEPLPLKNINRKIGVIYRLQNHDVYWNGKFVVCQKHQRKTRDCVECAFVPTCDHSKIKSQCKLCKVGKKRPVSFRLDEKTQTKKCIDCEQILDISNYAKGGKNSPDGYQPFCRIDRQKRRKKAAKKKVIKKYCSGCRTEKDATEFASNFWEVDNLQTYCKVCSNNFHQARNKKLEARNPEIIKALQLKLYPDGKKACTRCGNLKELHEFYKLPRETDGLAYTCISCDLFKRKLELEEKREFKKKFMEGKVCEMCGNTNSITFDFAHLNRNTKAKRKRGKNIGNRITPAVLSLSQLRKEIPKTRILCAWCHRKETAEENNDSKELISKWKDKRRAEIAIFIKKKKLEIGGCAHCSLRVKGNYFRQFDFDHLPNYKKVASISDMVSSWSYSKEDIMNELKKTCLVCVNCHRIKTALRREVKPVMASLLTQIDKRFDLSI